MDIIHEDYEKNKQQSMLSSPKLVSHNVDGDVELTTFKNDAIKEKSSSRRRHTSSGHSRQLGDVHKRSSSRSKGKKKKPRCVVLVECFFFCLKFFWFSKKIENQLIRRYKNLELRLVLQRLCLAALYRVMLVGRSGWRVFVTDCKKRKKCRKTNAQLKINIQ